MTCGPIRIRSYINKHSLNLRNGGPTLFIKFSCIVHNYAQCRSIVNLAYLPADCHTSNALVNIGEDRLLSSSIRNSNHVLRPLPLSSPDGLIYASELIHLPYGQNMTHNVFPCPI